MLTVLGPVARVAAAVPGRGLHRAADGGSVLSGVKVLDLSAYLAGPVGAAVLAELGADVVKVEPVTGDVHRHIEPLFAAGQRGKRSVAVDLKAPGAGRVLERLFGWADVVHHNSRLGLAERLGYDESTVRAANPDVVYSFASGFGSTGPRAPLPANDQLMQALAGVEAAQGGFGAAPTFLSWGAIDVAGGWVSACGVLAALYARRRTGAGQSVSSSLLAAGMLLKSGAFVAGGTVAEGPVLDADQLGYGAAYRLYEGADGGWLALAVSDQSAWDALGRLIGGLPASPPPLRTVGGERQPEEALLEAAFASRPVSEWVHLLRATAVSVEAVPDLDRTGFISRIVDDPVNRQLGRVITYRWGERGRIDQTRFAPRFGPDLHPRGSVRIPELGEHTPEVLEEAGIDAPERALLAEHGIISS
jgi:crotonobetainyl-CoA:carnitine CoA-transferase CaiB-like acyl-CoA transferase